MTDQPTLSPNLTAVLDGLIQYAKDRIEATGQLDPFGLVVTVDGERSFLSPFVAEQYKGLAVNKMVRVLEDLIRLARAKKPLSFAAIIYGGELRPLEGGDGTPAVTGRLEERPGIAVQVIVPVEIRDEHVILGERKIIQKDHFLLR